MRGLLQRLAGQALGAKGASASPRIRSAMSVHAQVPLALPAADETLAINPYGTPGSLQPTAETDRGIAAPEAVRVPALHVDAPTAPLIREFVRRTMSEVARPQSHPMQAASDHPPEPAVPTPLLDEIITAPLPPRTIAPAFVHGASASQSGHATAGSEPTEVHVHIGRIEVTAVAEPEKPKKTRPSAPRQTLSLADYLARRSRK